MMATSHAAAATNRAGDRLRPKAAANATVGNTRAQADSTAATKPALIVAANTTAPIRCQMDETSSTKAAQEAAHNTASHAKNAKAAGPTPEPGVTRNVARRPEWRCRRGPPRLHPVPRQHATPFPLTSPSSYGVPRSGPDTDPAFSVGSLSTRRDLRLPGVPVVGASGSNH